MRWKPFVVVQLSLRGAVPLVSVGHLLADEYLDFLRARARPNTVLATTFDLKVFFLVEKAQRVTSGDAMGFIRAQRGVGQGSPH